MPRTIVITGGTSGIGKALARHYASRGERVVAIGSTEEGGRLLREEAPEVRFVRADLSSPRRTREVVERLGAEYPAIDALVLGAYRHSLRRVETEEGFERTFALLVVNRLLMAEGLRASLERAAAPVIVNLCGVGSVRAGRVRWDDLQFTRSYRPFAATIQGTRAIELLSALHAHERIRYVLYNPLFVDTGLHKPFRQPTRALVRVLAALFAQPVHRSVPPIAALIDRPPAEPVSAYRRGRPVPIDVDLATARAFEQKVRALTSPFVT